MKRCLEGHGEFFGRFYCPKCRTIYRTEKEYKNSLLFIWGFFIVMFFVFLLIGMTIEWWFACLWFFSPFSIWFFMWIFTKRINSYNELEG